MNEELRGPEDIEVHKELNDSPVMTDPTKVNLISAKSGGSFSTRYSDIEHPPVIRQSPLSFASARRFFSEGDFTYLHSCNLHQLGLLVREISPSPRIEPASPTILLPLGKFLEEGGMRSALDSCRRLLLEQNGKCDSVFVRLDRWTGRFRSEDLLDVLSQLSSSLMYSFRLQILGPTPTELASLASTGSAETLLRLKKAGVCMLRVGADLELAHSALHLGISPLLSWSANGRSDTRLSSSRQPRRTEASELHFDWQDLFGHLLHLRATLSFSNQNWHWYPTLADSALLSQKITVFAGENVLRMIAFARLMLPSAVISPPLEGVNALFTSLCCQFGASNFGFVALDTNTAQRLYLPRICKPVSSRALF